MDTIRGVTEPILIIEAPPRHGKSEYISKYLTTWLAGIKPDWRTILTSYEANFAREWGLKSKLLLKEFGRSLFGVELSRERQSASDWGIEGHEGGMCTAGAGGPIMGRGADVFIIDDPIKNSEEAFSEATQEQHWNWWQSTAVTRLTPTGVVIIIATRWHREDLSGRLIAAAEDGTGRPVRRIHLPAIAEEDDQFGRSEGEPLWNDEEFGWPVPKLDLIRKSVDVYWWNSLYQQRPGNHANSEWPASYFEDHIWVAA